MVLPPKEREVRHIVPTNIYPRPNPHYSEKLAYRLWRLSILGYCKEDDKVKSISQLKYQVIRESFARTNDF